MAPEDPTPENFPLPDRVQPVNSWATWYADECRENAVEPTTISVPSFNPILAPDISPDDVREPNPSTPAQGASPPPITPNIPVHRE